MRRMASPLHQRGIASIEFAAVFSALFVLFYAIATFGALFFTQQLMARAAEDGVRAVAVLPNGPAPDPLRVRDVVFDALAGSPLVPASAGQTPASRRSWLAANLQVAVTSSAAGDVTVQLVYSYSANPLMPSIALLDASRWVPDRLTQTATIARPV
ncbi:MAG: pilus assembly protein [Comamonadaceae bacterium]|nr:MAG: pilus assembly protein [Comamonadaceae bacterium]